mgnify:CR=1 FL=1
MTIVKVKRLRDAVAAYCATCNHWIDRNQYWGLDKTIALHRYGCEGAKITYYGFST